MIHDNLILILILLLGVTILVMVGQKLKIDKVYAEINPRDKNQWVENLKKEGKVVAMAGDGINDAPALAAADVGIAMGTGIEAAIESAQVILIKGDLAGIVRAIALSQMTMAKYECANRPQWFRKFTSQAGSYQQLGHPFLFAGNSQ